MVRLTCDACGGAIEVDESREFGYCEYCGTKYFTKSIVNETTVINHNYHGATINIYQEQKNENGSQIGETLFVEEFKKKYSEISETFLESHIPNEVRIKKGLFGKKEEVRKGDINDMDPDSMEAYGAMMVEFIRNYPDPKDKESLISFCEYAQSILAQRDLNSEIWMFQEDIANAWVMKERLLYERVSALYPDDLRVKAIIKIHRRINKKGVFK